MSFRNKLLRYGLVVVPVLMLPLAAQDKPLSFEMKMRAGLTTGALQKDHFDNKAMGFGVAASYPMGKTAAVTAELSFDLLPGRHRDVMPAGGTVWVNPANPVTTTGSTPYTLNPTYSYDDRKESSQGFSLRLGYTDSFPVLEGLSWQAGISLDRYAAKSEFKYTFIAVPTPPAVTQPDGTAVVPYEGGTFVAGGTKIVPGLFVGVKYAFAKDKGLEFNIRNIGAAHNHFIPFTYTGQAARLESSTSRGFVFEFALSVKI
ncbi:MAG: hypothetical protein Q8O00_02740 [Holophaga sp.]|nr:hypothetical protein [Holophaga sp.]